MEFKEETMYISKKDREVSVIYLIGKKKKYEEDGWDVLIYRHKTDELNILDNIYDFVLQEYLDFEYPEDGKELLKIELQGYYNTAIYHANKIFDYINMEETTE